MRVSASSVISSVAETSATPARWRARDGDGHAREVYHSACASRSMPAAGPSLRRAFVGATIAWALLLPLAPFAASRPHAAALVAALFACVVYAIGSLVCHQLPERSFHLWSAQMPVCARCTGIYAGAALARLRGDCAVGGSPAVGARRHRRRGARRRSVRSRTSPCLALALRSRRRWRRSSYEWTTGDMPAHSIRAAAGVPIGAASRRGLIVAGRAIIR